MNEEITSALSVARRLIERITPEARIETVEWALAVSAPMIITATVPQHWAHTTRLKDALASAAPDDPVTATAGGVALGNTPDDAVMYGLMVQCWHADVDRSDDVAGHAMGEVLAAIDGLSTGSRVITVSYSRRVGSVIGLQHSPGAAGPSPRCGWSAPPVPVSPPDACGPLPQHRSAPPMPVLPAVPISYL
jgi:hypothetical protein